MRVGLVVRRLSAHGGTERFTLGFARALVAAGHDVTAHCRGADLDVPGLRVSPLGGWAGRGRVLKGALLERAAAQVPRGSADVTIGFLRAPGFDVLRAGGGAHAAWLDGRNPGIADQQELARDARALRSAGRVVFNSEMARQDALGHHPLDPERLHVVRNGVDLHRFQPNTSAAPERRILFIGHGWTRKGLDTALAALALLRGCRLGVVGRDPNPRRFRRAAAALGVSDRVDWLGSVDRVEALLPRALALVLPTRYDPSANVCLEAMACGVPVVTSGRDGAGEILPEPWQVVSRPDDAEGFAGALDRVLQTPSLRPASRVAAEAWPESRAHHALAHLAGVPLP
jgi:UDP-glucose:(heptosyl)LPS alpha-1,3-glucosyltransferase